MKMKSLVISAAIALTATAAVAQSVEYDDMYFNSKDRQKLKEKQAAEAATFSQAPSSKHKQSVEASEVYADNGNYSPRNQNPEFAARSNASAASDDAEYFSSNYNYGTSYANASNLQNWNNSYNNWYSNPWVANNFWGSSIYGWNSPYYGSYYDSWGNPWMNPYYGSGWSSSFSMYMGNSWNYGWGNGFGMGFGYSSNPFNNSWAGWNMGFGGGFGYFGRGYGYYGYPSMVVINNDYGRTHAYGKRGTQNGMVTRNQSANTNLRPTTTPSGGSRPTYNGNSGGRVATSPTTSPTPSRGQVQRQDDYYNRNWRTSRQSDVYGGRTNSYSQPSRSSQSNGWGSNSSQSQWNRSGGNDNGRSGYSGGSTAPARSSAPASSGSGGRTRGRD